YLREESDKTGATGLISGGFLDELCALVRNPSKAKFIEQSFPKEFELSQGPSEMPPYLKPKLLPEFANCDHLPAAEAIVRGLSQSDQIGAVIHTFGAKIIVWEMKSQPFTWGKLILRRYNDMEGVEELTRGPSEANPEPTGHDHILPNRAAHRNVDSYSSKARTAIICPLTMYSPSRFPVFTTSIQIPQLWNVILQLGQAFTINGNASNWNKIYTQEISLLYVLLPEAAVDG
ncbi:nucleoside-diphosphate-sugar epimerase, partial [Penicillium coprophilum]|uniref:nucleoside-diphosphate-sugar epimerase n=1 Tax=Penicillium coprophilum TaxID=36646 RepID=UPI00239DFECE